MVVPLTEMAAGQSGMVGAVEGGRGFVRRMEAMGIRAGVSLTKISGQPFRGPVSIRVGQTTVALGAGMARRIMVDIPG